MSGIHGHGTTLTIDDNSTNVSTTFTASTAITNITVVGAPDKSADDLDITNMGSTSKYREFIRGLLDAGEMTIDVNYDGTTAASPILETIFASTAAAHRYAIVWPDSSFFSSAGYMKGDVINTPHDDKITQTITVKLTGVPVYNAA